MKHKTMVPRAAIPLKVLVSICLRDTSWRTFFGGFLSYANESGNWDLRMLPEPGDLTESVIDRAEQDGIDGIFAGGTGIMDFNRLCRTTIPVATFGFGLELGIRRTDIVRANDDCEAAGAMGARHLMSRGRRAIYGFVRSRSTKGDWSFRRQEAFLSTVRAAGGKTAAYELPPDASEDDDLGPLRDWLLSLPKPAAVMADWDRRAAQVITACRDGGLRVPEDVSVLGVDNDAMFVGNTRPTLSSIALGQEEGGYRVAAALDRIMRAKKRPQPEATVNIGPLRVVARESTRHVALGDILAQRIAAYIDGHSAGKLEVADVVRHIRCSRRHAEQSFQKAKKRTIHDYIVQRRMEEIKRRLMRSDATIAEVADECGFSAQSHLTRFFKQATGLTPQEWRLSHS